jgi:2Fe-2S ferredoxin
VSKVTFVKPTGDELSFDVNDGTSVMQAAVSNGVTEIVAECGGTLACATCHVYVAENFLDKLSPVSSDEEEMLDYTAADREPGSRLSCQLAMGPELDGIVVRLPTQQY